MGFGRTYADASVTFTYICSLDTAIPSTDYPACGPVPEPSPDRDEPFTQDELEAARKAARTAHLGAYLARFYATPAGEAVDPLEREFLATLTEPESVTVFCQRRTERHLHRDYQRTGSEALLGELAADVIRFRLHNLPAPDRATAIGMAQEKADGLTEYARKYRVARFVLERTLIGADGWPDFKQDKQTKHIAAACFDVFDPEWVVEIGYFLLDLPNLTDREKKA